MSRLVLMMPQIRLSHDQKKGWIWWSKYMVRIGKMKGKECVLRYKITFTIL